MIRRPPRSTLSSSSAASDVYKRQMWNAVHLSLPLSSLPQGTDRESPSSRSRKPATSRLSSEESKKQTPRSTSCDMGTWLQGPLSPKRGRKERAGEGTPRGAKKKEKMAAVGNRTVVGERRKSSGTRSTDRKSPITGGARIASPTLSGSKTSREDRRSPGTRVDRAGAGRRKKKVAKGEGEQGQDMEVDRQESPSREILVDRTQLGSRDRRTELDSTIPSSEAVSSEALNASVELKRLYQYIVQTISYQAPATTVLQLLDECIVCTKQLFDAIAELPTEQAMLQRDMKDLYQLRHSAGHAHPDCSLMLISLERVMAVADHLRPPESASPEWGGQVLTESPPIQPFHLHTQLGSGKQSPASGKDSPTTGKESPAVLTIGGDKSGAGYGTLIHMHKENTQAAEQENPEDLCPVHFRKLRESAVLFDTEDKKHGGRQSQGDLSDCSECSSDAEIQSMNRNLMQAFTSPRPVELSESPDFLISEIMSRLTMEDGRHFTGLDDLLEMHEAQLNEHVPKGYSTEELGQIADRKLLELVVPNKDFEDVQCNVCFSKLLSGPSMPEETDSDSDSDSDCEPLEIRESLLLTKLPCAHIFHDACIEKWFCFGRSCPTCRASVLPTNDKPTQNPTAPTNMSEGNSSAMAASEGIGGEDVPDQRERMMCPITEVEQVAVRTRGARQMIRVPALPLHAVKSAPSEHSTPRTPSAPNSARLPMSPRSAFTGIKSHRSNTESDVTPRSEPAYSMCTPRCEHARQAPHSAR
eukprot:TRINITY_DN22409_c0_g2_i1.p1 TRINITY_DN22409_c0_g2~~TRINITY_DN22409_c0_g2_i1.p1  ORF type:complete len:755 (-),score=128.21 TRINITY_DN22409_c0_g2_i1:344-2608(-)